MLTRTYLPSIYLKRMYTKMALVGIFEYLQRAKPRPLVTRAFHTVVNDVRTDLIYNEYVSYHLIIAKQVGGHVTAYKVNPANDSFVEPRYSVNKICGTGDMEYAAKLLAEIFKVKEPLLLFFRLKNYDDKTINACIETLSKKIL